MTKHRLFALGCALLAGCTANSDYVGSGPIELGPQAQRVYTDYLERPNPVMFAVTEDGAYGYYSYCDTTNCYAQTQAQITDACRRAYGQPCKVYAKRRTVIWQG